MSGSAPNYEKPVHDYDHTHINYRHIRRQESVESGHFYNNTA